MKDIVMMWIQGSGKWVQSRLILDKFYDKVDYFEMWQILRDISRGQNVLGKYIQGCVNKWDLVDDEFAAGIFDLFVQTLGTYKHALLDWYPRTPAQLRLFLEVMKNRGRNFTVIYLHLEKKVSIQRIMSRRICKECGKAHNLKLDWDILKCKVCGWLLYQRDDEKDMSVVDRRVQNYLNITRPLIDELSKMGNLVEVNADQSIEDVFKEVENIIK